MSLPTSGGERIGLLGGTFDPPHYGHLLAAQEAAWRLSLQQVLFLPARQNPLKMDEPMSAAEDRCEMTRLAVMDNPLFELSRADMDRPAPSYTVDLLHTLIAAHAPGTEFFFLVGGDILAELPHWYQPTEALRLATFVVVTRPGWDDLDRARLEETLPMLRQRLLQVDTPGMDIASTEIRRRVAEGIPVRYLVPPAVEAYITQRGLYTDGDHESALPAPRAQRQRRESCGPVARTDSQPDHAL